MSLKAHIKRGIKYITVEGGRTQVAANVAVLAPNELLAGRTALITGGTSGIGLAIARAFLQKALCHDVDR